jgi:hypothetical protein
MPKQGSRQKPERSPRKMELFADSRKTKRRKKYHMTHALPIIPYTHRCVIQSGNLAGNEHSREVDAWEYENGEPCQYCGEPLATTEKLLAHIYAQLTGE